MSEYEGYSIKRNPETGKWEIFWQGKKQNGDFEREGDAEQWIDDQMPMNR